MRSPYRLIWKLWFIAGSLALVGVSVTAPGLATAAVLFASVATACGTLAGYHKALHDQWWKRELERRTKGLISFDDE